MHLGNSSEAIILDNLTQVKLDIDELSESGWTKMCNGPFNAAHHYLFNKGFLEVLLKKMLITSKWVLIGFP